MLTPLAVLAIVSLRSGEPLSSLPFAENLQTTFASTQKAESADIRVSLWQEGRRLAEIDPFEGLGLGQKVSVFQDIGTNVPLEVGDFHNIFIDVAVRNGVPGLVLFLLASAGSIWACLQVWRRAVDAALAALAIASAIVFTELLVKGLFESVFQKYRLAVLIGFLIGLMSSVAASYDRGPQGGEPAIAEPVGARWN